MLHTVALELLPTCVSRQLHTQESLSCQGFVFLSLSPCATDPQRRILQESSHFCEELLPGCGCLYHWCRKDSTFMDSLPSICPSDLLSLWTWNCAGQAFRDDWPVVWLLQAPCFWVMGVSGLLRRAVSSISGFLAFMHQHKGNLRQSYFIFLLIQDQSPYNPLVL